MTRIQKSVPAFKKQIETSLKPEGNERTGKVTGEEMTKALKKLPTTKAGIKAANDLFGTGVKMDAAAKKALKGFIEQNGGEVASPTTPSRPTGVRTAETVADVKTMLKNDDFRESMITAAFGNIRSRSSSYEVSSVKKNGEGFDLVITKSHWMTRAVQDEVVVFMNKAGVPSTLPGIGGNPQPAINIHPDTFRPDGGRPDGGRPQPAIQPLPNTFVDTTKFAKDLGPKARELLMEHGERLSRSDAVIVGDVVKNTKGTMDVTFQVAHFLTKEVRKEITLEIGLDKKLIGGALPGVGDDPQPAINIHPDTFRPGGHGTGVRLASTVADVKEMLTSQDYKSQIINAAFGNALSRSSTYEIGSIQKSGDGFDIVVEKRMWRTGDLQDDVVVHINRAGVPSTSADTVDELPYTPMPGPIGGARPALMERAKLKEKLEENARSIVMGDLGQTLSRSDAVEVTSMTKNDRGTYDVVFTVVHWQTREPRMELPFEVEKDGTFVAAG